MMADGTDCSEDPDDIECPFDCKYREDIADIVEYDRKRANSLFPWTKEGTVWFRLKSPYVTVNMVRQ